MSSLASRQVCDQQASAVAPAAASHIAIAGISFIADPSGALFQPDASLLVVADLHLEKGSALARRGVFLPPYDTVATLDRLARLIAAFSPRIVLALGDSFHDNFASERMDAGNIARLQSLQAGRDWLWIAGNHDPAPPQGFGGRAQAGWSLGGVDFRHEPQPVLARGEISGHLHPVARVGGSVGIVRRRCFASDGQRCIMPAFGAYAGGLNLRDAAFGGLFEAPVTAHVLGKDRIYAIGHHACLPEARINRGGK